MTNGMLTLRVNGETRIIDRPMTVLAYLEANALVLPFMAVARNGDVLLKSEYATVSLQDGDVLEIVRMVGGG
jgi:sulfur carrier protein